MIYFLYGPDAYRSKEKLDEMIGQYKQVRKSGLNLIYLDASQISFSDFYDSFKISSMFDEKKLIVLKNVFLNKSFQEDFVKEIKKLETLKDNIIVYENGEVDQRLKIFKILTKECKAQEFLPLDGKGLKLWAQKELEKYKAKIHADALDLVLAYTGNDLWRVSQEIKKLADFKKDSVIRKDDVEVMVKPRIELDIFKTIDALAAKNKKQALVLLRKHLDGGDNALYMLSMIGYQFKNLLVVKELAQKGLMYASIVKKSGLHPFVVKKTYFASSQFTFDELKHIYRKIFQVDLDIKTGKIEPETALDLLVSQI